jgi:hypothetical protein
MLFGERGWWRDTDDLDELVLENGEVRVAFLEGVGAKGLNDADVVAGMRFWLQFLVPMREGTTEKGHTVDVMGTEISKSLCLAFPLTPDEIPFETGGDGGFST